jgi:hypothetical protein
MCLKDLVLGGSGTKCGVQLLREGFCCCRDQRLRVTTASRDQSLDLRLARCKRADLVLVLLQKLRALLLGALVREWRLQLR